MLLLFSLLLSFWFNRALLQFPDKINRQIYQDMDSLMKLPFSQQDFLSQSQLQPTQKKVLPLSLLLFPTVCLIFQFTSMPILLILFILVYLSLLDYCYYLTDVMYITVILILSLTHLLFFDEQIALKLLSVLILLLLCLAFVLFSRLLNLREGLGMGDILLLLALAPLFQWEQMISLLLIASVSGLAFYLLYGGLKKQKLIKLPFIPFISFATMMLIFLEPSFRYGFLNWSPV